MASKLSHGCRGTLSFSRNPRRPDARGDLPETVPRPPPPVPRRDGWPTSSAPSGDVHRVPKTPRAPERTMNALSDLAPGAQEQLRPLRGGGPGSLQDSPRCPPGFHLSSRLHLHGGQRSAKPQRELSAEEQQDLRRKINSRERKRMQDLNVAMDALREVMVPYASSSPPPPPPPPPPPSASSPPSHRPDAPPGRRLSKISTLVLARNYILLLSSSLQEMRRLLGDVSVGMGVNGGPGPRLLLAGGWPLMSGPGQLLLTQESLLTAAASSSSSAPSSAAAKCPLLSPGPLEAALAPVHWGAPGGGALCPCGACRLPRFGHAAAAPRFSK
ncbi:Oligodendrocyte transcription factor 1 [Liparis tanakae]|uniref:Oligodendrocyte transcription factor 1 n=1 Tax=Liparis tanakae TaxID=230148 RepID=A0A4Z2EMH7_9TELE|nr:Oligodendrocyte transcription factor 1 [Liparis tanakae]